MPVQDRVSSEAAFRYTARIDGRNLGEFDKVTGGDAKGGATKHRLGTNPDMKVVFGGPVDHDDVTLSRAFVYDRDYPDYLALNSRVDLARCEITRQPLDENGSPYGRVSYHKGGILNEVKFPPYDSTSNNTAMMEYMIVGGKWS